MLDILQIAGAIMVLIPYVWSLLGRLNPQTRTYLTSNLLGGSLLAVLALIGQNWGFLLLEGTWAVAAAYGLLTLKRS